MLICLEYPCEKYDGIDATDSFITHLNQKTNLEEIHGVGVAAYCVQLNKRRGILTQLLENYNDDRQKSLFSTAANLLNLTALDEVMRCLNSEESLKLTLKERARLAADALNKTTEKQGVSLKLRKKSRGEYLYN